MMRYFLQCIGLTFCMKVFQVLLVIKKTDVKKNIKGFWSFQR